MQTKNIYVGSNWEFQIHTDTGELAGDDGTISLYIPKQAPNVQKWEIEELIEFLKKYLENN